MGRPEGYVPELACRSICSINAHECSNNVFKGDPSPFVASQHTQECVAIYAWPFASDSFVVIGDVRCLKGRSTVMALPCAAALYGYLLKGCKSVVDALPPCGCCCSPKNRLRCETGARVTGPFTPQAVRMQCGVGLSQVWFHMPSAACLNCAVGACPFAAMPCPRAMVRHHHWCPPY